MKHIAHLRGAYRTCDRGGNISYTLGGHTEHVTGGQYIVHLRGANWELPKVREVQSVYNVLTFQKSGGERAHLGGPNAPPK